MKAPLDGFELLINDLAPPAEPAAAVSPRLSFGSEAHAGRVSRHRSRSGALLIEIEVLPTYETPLPGDAPVWALLHGLNHEAALGEGWLISLDDDEVLQLNRVLSWQGLAAADLRATLADGLQRAASLRTLWQSLAPLAATADAGVEPIGMAHVLRG